MTGWDRRRAGTDGYERTRRRTGWAPENRPSTRKQAERERTDQAREIGMGVGGHRTGQAQEDRLGATGCEVRRNVNDACHSVHVNQK